MSLKPVGSAGEENYLAMADRLGREVLRLSLTTLGEGGGIVNLREVPR
jgi:hypothetical protein